LPEQGNAPNFQNNNGGVDYAADGTTRINLRSLGISRTLVLLDGRRIVAGGLGASPAVDLNALPDAAVHRVDVLKEGGCAIYRSEAIAGVVNVITRRRFDGSQADAAYGVSSRGDAATVLVDAITGHSDERGGFVLSGSFFKQQPSWRRDRTWSASELYY